MCGFVAAIGRGAGRIEPPRLESMTRTLAHRGPDQEGFFRDDRIAFGFRRLAILDLSPAGHQPMSDEDGRFVLIFNGEIFNYLELRRDLQARGHGFSSTGDAEVLLKAFKEWGESCVRRFNGMFAFLVYDKVAGRVFGARDRFGVKPLYYALADDCLLFASEIKAIRASGVTGSRINDNTAARFLLEDRLDDTNDTFYSGVCRVPASSSFWIDVNAPRIPDFATYWNLTDEFAAMPADPPRDYLNLFEDAVRLRLRSDVPVGVSLSGGLDSTAVICAMARLLEREGASPKGLHAFSFQSTEFDESAYVKDTLAQTGATLVETGAAADTFWRELDTALWYHDEPVHSITALVGYKIMQLAAANGVKVILTGQGADEVLGGYSGYFSRKRESLVQQLRFAALLRETREYCASFGGSPGSIVLREIVRGVKMRFQRLPAFGAVSAARRRTELLSNPWFSEEYKREYRVQEFAEYEPGLTARLVESVQVSPLPLYLRIEDRNSMAHSVEARLPFLDYRLVALSFGLGEDWKVRGSLGKVLLREAMRGQIPESVRSRVDKMGFPAPAATWFRSDLYEAMGDLLGSRGLRERGIFNVAVAREMLERHKRNEVDASDGLFKLAQFERWMERSAAAS